MLLLSVVTLSSCSSSFKKERASGAFVADSDFLKQGRKIEEYVKIEEPKAVDDQDKKKNIVTVERSRAKSVKVKNIKRIKDHQKQIEEKTGIVKNKDFPFKVGEEVVLSATYFGMEAGKIAIGVDDFKKLNGKKQYHFYAFGKTSSMFSMFYNVKNKIESLWDPQQKKPQSLAFDVSETKQKYKARVYFDWLKRRGEYLEEGWSKKNDDYTVKKKWTLPKSAQDIVSAAFYVRTLPLTVGEEYKVAVMEEDKLIDVYFKVDRKEVLKTRIGKLNTLVLKPRFFTKGKFKQVGDISVWFTDDAFRQVVRIESKIKVGTVVAKLYSLKRPE
jgi:hypothetical protein